MRTQVAIEYLFIIAIIFLFLAIFLTTSLPSIPTQFKKEWGDFYNFEPVDWILYDNGTFILILKSKLPYEVVVLQINSTIDTEEVSLSPQVEMDFNETKNFTFQFNPKNGNYEVWIRVLYNNTLTNETKIEEGFVRWHTVAATETTTSAPPAVSPAA